MSGSRRHSALRCQFIGGSYDPARHTQGAARTALQRHVDFFDRDGNGVLTIREIASGLNRLQIGPFVTRLPVAILVALLLGRKTWGVVYPTLTINVDAIHRGRHKSTTGIFGPDGELDEARFVELFQRYDGDRDGFIEESELGGMMRGIASPGFANALSRFLARQELPTLMREFGERRADGATVLSRETLGQFYAGDLFPKLADAVARRPSRPGG